MDNLSISHLLSYLQKYYSGKPLKGQNLGMLYMCGFEENYGRRLAQFPLTEIEFTYKEIHKISIFLKIRLENDTKICYFLPLY